MKTTEEVGIRTCFDDFCNFEMVDKEKSCGTCVSYYGKISLWGKELDYCNLKEKVLFDLKSCEEHSPEYIVSD